VTTDGQPQGIRAQLRLLVSRPPEQRYDASGAEVLQIRGKVVDAERRHPQVVVRFGGQRRAELYRWAKLGKHLSVDGYLEVKTWLDQSSGRQLVALLVEAVNIVPLGDIADDLSRAGIYAVGRPSEPRPRKRLSKGERAERLRKELLEA
jgi:hypothetical protein